MAVPRTREAPLDGTNTFEHEPVMAREVVELLSTVPAGLVVDATVGGAGHSRLILGARPDLSVLGIDRDPAAVAAAGAALAPFGERARVVHGGFESVAELVRAHTRPAGTDQDMSSGEHEGTIVAILFDLGVSSPQLDRHGRGFSYWADDAPLDMRMDSSQELTAETVVNEYSHGELARVISTFGEERFAGQIASAIVAARPMSTVGELVEAIKTAIPAPARRKGPHPARRTFQALRMEVNRELPNLAAGLDESVHLLRPEGRMLVMAYHSLEDRMVKERFTEWSATEEPGYVPRHLPRPQRHPLTRLLTRRPLRPRADELAANSRAASARLRVVERLGS
jgi:16S rRNA (cytosine1402-N4)-methyltransferase